MDSFLFCVLTFWSYWLIWPRSTLFLAPESDVLVALEEDLSKEKTAYSEQPNSSLQPRLDSKILRRHVWTSLTLNILNFQTFCANFSLRNWNRVIQGRTSGHAEVLSWIVAVHRRFSSWKRLIGCIIYFSTIFFSYSYILDISRSCLKDFRRDTDK